MIPRAFCFALLTGLAPASHAASRPSSTREVRESTASGVAIPPPLNQLHVGERLSFRGRWFGIPVGRGWIEVKGIEEWAGRRVYRIEAEGRTTGVFGALYPVRDSIVSHVDAETLEPLRFEKHQREGRYRADEVVLFDHQRHVANYRSLLNGSEKEIPIPPDVHDIVSGFYWLRMRAADPNHPIRMAIYSDERVYETEIKPIRAATLELLRSTFPCLVIEPLAQFKGILVRRGRMWVYVSADPYRIPLFVRVTTPWGPLTGIIDRASLRAMRHRSS